MLNMQAFHQSLSLPVKALDTRHNHLASLTHVKRDQILALTSEFTWVMWSEDEGGSSSN